MFGEPFLNINTMFYKIYRLVLEDWEINYEKFFENVHSQRARSKDLDHNENEWREQELSQYKNDFETTLAKSRFSTLLQQAITNHKEYNPLWRRSRETL